MEKRRFTRTPADLMVLCENFLGKVTWAADGTPKMLSCSLADISLGGVKMITSHNLGLGSVIHVVMMTSSVNQPLELEGIVVWEKAIPDTSFYVAVKFRHISRENEKMLRDFFELL